MGLPVEQTHIKDLNSTQPHLHLKSDDDDTILHLHHLPTRFSFSFRFLDCSRQCFEVDEATDGVEARQQLPASIMNTDEDALTSVYKKIERERALLNAANQMRQQTQNELVRNRIDTQIKEGRRNIRYLEERMQELQLRTHPAEYQAADAGAGGSGGGGGRVTSPGFRSDRDHGPGGAVAGVGAGARRPAPSNKPDDYGGYGNQEFSQIGAHGDAMPSRHPYPPPGPGQGVTRTRPNYTKLGRWCASAWMCFLADACSIRSHQV